MENVSVRLTASDHCVTQMLGQAARLHMVLVYVGTQTRKLPIPVRDSALLVLVPILELTSVHFLIRNYPKVR